MTSIYSRLFTYRERAARAPLEDFLSEALADLLNRLPRDRSLKLAATLFIPSGAAQEAWAKEIAKDSKFLWRTQSSIRSGAENRRLDLLLELDSHPALVVENKIASPVRIHRSEESGEQESPNQLTDYGRWLQAECKETDWKGGLALLTHWSVPPEDFGGPRGSAYGVPWQHTCRWSRVYRELRSLSEIDLRQPEENKTGWRALSADLAEFLMENGMESEVITELDIAAAHLFVGSSNRISESFRKIYDKIKLQSSDYVIRKDWSVEYDSDSGTCFSWAYVKSSPSNKNNWYASWGIRFPDRASLWNDCRPELPPRAHAFVSIGAENEPSLPFDKLSPADIPSGWSLSADREDAICGLPLSSFPATPEAFTEDLSVWISDKLQQFAPVIKSRP